MGRERERERLRKREKLAMNGVKHEDLQRLAELANNSSQSVYQTTWDRRAI